MPRLALVLCSCLLALIAAPAARAACPDLKPSYTSACGPQFTLPQWSDAAGWEQRSSYYTIQPANVDGEPGDELLGRSPVGVWVERFDAARGQWGLVGTSEGGLALTLPDVDGWNRPEYYETMQAADVNGDGAAELLIRGKDGLHTYRWHAAGRTFDSIGEPPLLFPNSEHWSQPWHYQTIQTGDVDGDGAAELLARAKDGLHTYRWNDSTSRYDQVGETLTALADSPDEWYWPGYYQTIQTADVDGDGDAELLARGADGLHTWRWADGWTEAGPVLGLTDAQGWDKPGRGATIQTADVDGNGAAELLGRGEGGLHTWRWTDGWTEVGTVLGGLSNANGWVKPDHYATIQTGDLDGDRKAELLARNSAGILVWRWNGGGWTELSAGVPALADDPWAKQQHYETLQTGDPDGDGRADLLGRGVFGVRTFVWDAAANSFRRPQPYGVYPPFAAEPEQKAYAALAQLLLGREADFRVATYAGPSETISEATLDRYRGLLAERCQPVARRTGLPDPPRYSNCTPPQGSGVDGAAWTAVSNQIIAELWAAAGVVAHFTALDTIQTKLFQDQQGTLPALDAALKLPPNVPDRAPTFLKLIKSALEIVSDIAQLTPIGDQYKKVIRAVALTAHSLGAIGEGLGLKSVPDPPQAWARITDEVARIQQRERDITEAQRRYVLADYGLLMTTGSLVNGRLLTLDTTAMLSAGRQSFATWVYQLYTPAFWKRYDVSGCWPETGYSCEPPQGRNVRHLIVSGSFLAVLSNQSGCTRYPFFIECNWAEPGEVGGRVWGDVSEECRYDSTPGSSAAWRYGCNLGVPGGNLVDQKAGWQFATTICKRPRPTDMSLCKDVASARLQSGRVRVDVRGNADLRLVGSVAYPGPLKPRRMSVALGRVLLEDEGEGELVNHPSGARLSPTRLKRLRGGTSRRVAVASARRRRGPEVNAMLIARPPRFTRRLAVRLRVDNARLERPAACIGRQRHVRLETRLRLALPSGKRVSYPMRGRWTCATAVNGRLMGLRLRRPPGRR
jgi:FG-GAP-like repeat